MIDDTSGERTEWTSGTELSRVPTEFESSEHHSTDSHSTDDRSVGACPFRRERSLQRLLDDAFQQSNAGVFDSLLGALTGLFKKPSPDFSRSTARGKRVTRRGRSSRHRPL